MKTNFNNLTYEEMDIIEYLKNYCDGVQHAISNEGLAHKFSIDKRTMRNLIQNLITNHHVPIGSCSKNHSGIFYCVTDKDYEIASRELLSRIKKLSKRHKGLRLGHFKESKQLQLMEVI